MTAAATLGAGALSACSLVPPKPTVSSIARQIIADMSLEDKIAQLFIVCPEQLSGTGLVTEPDQLYCERLQVFPVGGVIFSTDNIVDPAQTQTLLAQSQVAMQDMGLPPLFLCVDEEGGTVQRIGGREGFEAPFVSNMSEIGAADDEELAAETARTIARSIKDLGFNTDFAPSCDIVTSETSSMHSRAFGGDPELVTRMVLAQVSAFEEEGVLCCAKHFPGIGDPEEDSHELSIFSGKTHEELAIQLMPFTAAIDAGVPFVMMGHLSLPQVTGNDIPASLSGGIVQGILRDELGYDGVVVTDSLGMGALASFVSPKDVAVAAIEAGCDIALMPSNLQEAYNELLAVVESGRISVERIDQSLERILSLKLRSFPDLFDEATREELAECEETQENGVS